METLTVTSSSMIKLAGRIRVQGSGMRSLLSEQECCTQDLRHDCILVVSEEDEGGINFFQMAFCVIKYTVKSSVPLVSTPPPPFETWGGAMPPCSCFKNKKDRRTGGPVRLF